MILSSPSLMKMYQLNHERAFISKIQKPRASIRSINTEKNIKKLRNFFCESAACIANAWKYVFHFEMRDTRFWMPKLKRTYTFFPKVTVLLYFLDILSDWILELFWRYDIFALFFNLLTVSFVRVTSEHSEGTEFVCSYFSIT